jgi:hypothetical protein
VARRATFATLPRARARGRDCPRRYPPQAARPRRGPQAAGPRVGRARREDADGKLVFEDVVLLPESPGARDAASLEGARSIPGETLRQAKSMWRPTGPPQNLSREPEPRCSRGSKSPSASYAPPPEWSGWSTSIFAWAAFPPQESLYDSRTYARFGPLGRVGRKTYRGIPSVTFSCDFLKAKSKASGSDIVNPLCA